MLPSMLTTKKKPSRACRMSEEERKIKEGSEERNERAESAWKNRGGIFGEFGGMRKRRESREIRGRANV